MHYVAQYVANARGHDDEDATKDEDTKRRMKIRQGRYSPQIRNPFLTEKDKYTVLWRNLNHRADEA